MYMQMQRDVMRVWRADGVQGLKHFPWKGLEVATSLKPPRRTLC